MTAPSPSLQGNERPVCPRCGARMQLARVERESREHEKQTFECPACGHQQSAVVRSG